MVLRKFVSAIATVVLAAAMASAWAQNAGQETANAGMPEALTLKAVGGSIYADASGKRYSVRPDDNTLCDTNGCMVKVCSEQDTCVWNYCTRENCAAVKMPGVNPSQTKSAD